MKFQMRMPTGDEYNELCVVTHSSDDLMHWSGMYSWVDHGSKSINYNYPYIPRRGVVTADNWSYGAAFERKPDTGFRPAFDCETPDELPDDLNPGDVIVIGSLYMDSDIVCIPQKYNPLVVTAYRPKQKLELRDATGEPNREIWGVYIGDGVFIADRPLLCNVSRNDIDYAL